MISRKLIIYSFFTFIFFTGCGFNYYFNAGLKARNPKSKIKYFTKAILKWHPDNGEKNKLNVYTNRGISFSLIDSNESALADFTTALTFGEDSSTYYNRALVYYKQNKIKNAIEDLNSALKLNPMLGEARVLRGNLFKKTGNIKRANEDFKIADKISKSNSPFNAGIKFYNNELYDKAIESFTNAVNINPNNVTALNMRGLAYIQKGNSNKALNDFSKAIEIDSSCIDAYNNRGTIYASNKKYEKALNDFNRILELDPKSPEAYYNIGMLNQMKNDYKSSLLYFSESIKYSQKKPNDITYYYRGYSYYMLGNYKEAVKDFSTAIKINPANSLAFSYKEKTNSIINKTDTLKKY